MLIFPVLAYRAREPDRSLEQQARARLRLAVKDDFYLRTTRTGYNWADPDPDGLLPAAHPPKPGGGHE